MSSYKEIPIPTEEDIRRLNRRYFIIFFTAVTKNGIIEDSVNIECKGFPNCAETINSICDMYDAQHCNITGIKELSELDFRDWEYCNDYEEFYDEEV